MKGSKGKEGNMRRRQSILVLVAAVSLIAAASPAQADEGDGRPPGFAIGLIRDLHLKNLAERALSSDRVLAPLDLSVKVRNGVAEISGSVPSAEVGRQAVAKLETIQGISDVRPRFRYPNPAPMTTDLPKQGGQTVTEAAKPITKLPEDIDLPKTRPGGPAIVTGGEGRKARPEDPAQLPPMESTPLPGSTKPSGAVLKQPRAVTSVAGKADPAARAPSLAERVDRARKSQDRFRRIAVEVQGDVILVRRSGARSEDATALAQILRRLPGVSEVVMSSD
jgi:hypothetical protein